jgi:hypothetical protein
LVRREVPAPADGMIINDDAPRTSDVTGRDAAATTAAAP